MSRPFAAVIHLEPCNKNLSKRYAQHLVGQYVPHARRAAERALRAAGFRLGPAIFAEEARAPRWPPPSAKRRLAPPDLLGGARRR